MVEVPVELYGTYPETQKHRFVVVLVPSSLHSACDVTIVQFELSSQTARTNQFIDELQTYLTGTDVERKNTRTAIVLCTECCYYYTQYTACPISIASYSHHSALSPTRGRSFNIYTAEYFSWSRSKSSQVICAVGHGSMGQLRSRREARNCEKLLENYIYTHFNLNSRQYFMFLRYNILKRYYSPWCKIIRFVVPQGFDSGCQVITDGTARVYSFTLYISFFPLLLDVRYTFAFNSPPSSFTFVEHDMSHHRP